MTARLPASASALAPAPLSPIQAILEGIHARFAADTAGEVATYIPELAKADPAAFGIVLCTVDGQVYEVGDSGRPFTIQSVSKPLVYGVALEDQGPARVAQAVGVEPSGEAFNSISLEPGTGRPLNPMINAGAIAVASLVGGDTRAARIERLRGALSAYAGRELAIDEAVFESERATGHRNRAIGHLLRNYDILRDDPEEALEVYFRQCALSVTARDLAVMAATLANGGTNPCTGRRAVAEAHVGSILSVMATCGIYDFSGEWIYRVGLPAKSGVGGGILAVLPGQLGIGVFSPPLDARGNSVRGVKACEALSAELGLHFLQPPRGVSGGVRARYTLAQVRSRRRRSPAETALLDAQGAAVPVFELQGDLRFTTLEPLLRDVQALQASAPALRALVLDFKRVAQVDAAALHLLARLIEGCAAQGVHVLLSRVRRDALAELGPAVAPRWARDYGFHAQLDLALEAGEQRLLAAQAAPPAPMPDGLPALAAHRLCQGATAEDVAALAACTEARSHAAGERLVARGDPADALLLLVRGEVAVLLPLPGGGHKRLASLSAGMALGETALTTGGRRTADVIATRDVDVLRLSRTAFERLQHERPQLAIRLLHNLLAASGEVVARLTAEVAALEG